MTDGQKKVLFMRTTDEWATPEDLFKKLDDEFHFDLDPCSNDKNHKCKKYYTMQDNGLMHSWMNHTVFCNPPYSQIAKWVEKAYLEAQDPDTLVVMLIPSRTDTQYFHRYILHRSEVRFIEGRVRFVGLGRYNAPFPSMIVIWRGCNR